MSTAPSAFDPELVDQTRQQLRGLVHEIESLSRSEISHAEFYEGFLNRVVAALAAVGGAVWSLEEGGRLKLAYQTNLREARLAESPEAQQQHGMLLSKVIQQGQGILVPPHSGAGEDGSAANPTEFLLLLATLKSDKDVQGVVEIFQRPGNRPTVERGYLRFLTQMCELAGDFLKTRHLRLFADRQLMWTQLEQFTRLVHEGLNPNQTAYTIANEGRRLIGCDRVSVALRRGSRCKIEAISGQETMDKRSNTVSLLGKLATVVVSGGDDLWYTGDTTNLPPQIEEAVELYADEAHSKLVAVLPLIRPRPEPEVDEPAEPPEYLGALIVEQITDDAVTESMRRRIDVVTDHSALALTNSRDHNDLFLMPLWRTIGKLKWVVAARTLPKTVAIAGTVLLLLAALFLVPYPLQMSGRGTLEPMAKRDIFATVEGVVEKVFVADGAPVEVGQPLLKLRNTELDMNLTDVEGKLLEANDEREAVERSLHDRHLSPEEATRLRGQWGQLESRVQSLETQLHLLRLKEEQLKVVSPIKGKVFTWQLQDRLAGRPVEKGQLLLTVADPDQDWELEVHMPEDRMGIIARARKELQQRDKDKDLSVSYILATSPSKRHNGTLKSIAPIANPIGDEGNVVMLRVAIDKDEHDPATLRPGASITAKVDCGVASVGYVWFHDLIAFVQSRVLFRFTP